ncbi:hypothetical protein [Aureimonas sp. AU4]|uniref:hypothetical protein n=1 Tax=Aureimonas sp. AU4 TaxID=1638163 RepID=UPI0007805AA4|nr:hypothetical protein [Aureimonas sp. AU4]
MEHHHGVLDICGLVRGNARPSRDAALVVDLAACGIDVVERRPLGKGVFNDVSAGLLRGRNGTPGLWVALKGVGAQLFNGRPTTIQAGVGIDPAEPRLASRNIATSVLDAFIGTDVVPRCAAVIIGDEPFLAMTIAPGLPVTRCYRLDPSIVHDPVFQRRCNDLEVLAYLAGNPDVHSGNILVSTSRERAPGSPLVTLIDHDLSFGPKVDDPDRMAHIAGNNKRQYRHTGLPAYVDINTATRIRSMDREAVHDLLRRLLSPAELAAFDARLSHMSEHVARLKRMNRVVFDWRRFTNIRGEPLDGGNLIDGTLDWSGVLQGRQEGQDYVCPRSLIVRDCLEGRLGQGADLAALIGREHCERLVSWPRDAETRMAPGGGGEDPQGQGRTP